MIIKCFKVNKVTFHSTIVRSAKMTLLCKGNLYSIINEVRKRRYYVKVNKGNLYSMINEVQKIRYYVKVNRGNLLFHNQQKCGKDVIMQG